MDRRVTDTKHVNFVYTGAFYFWISVKGGNLFCTTQAVDRLMYRLRM